jgi:hypothetical protein
MRYDVGVVEGPDGAAQGGRCNRRLAVMGRDGTLRHGQAGM